ncbi:MAG: AMP-binding protein, partial [Gammaproteobacteria bacterium]
NVLALSGAADAGDITLINAVPSALRELLALGAIEDSVQVICSGGEALAAELADALYADTNIARLVDAYGPTEATVYATHAVCESGGVATIGRPNANMRIYILDPNCNPVPPGVTGELYIAGDGVARGYVNEPELTSERFQHVAFAGVGVERCYRTGDLAKYLPDGRVVLLGRLDHQLKVRGHRIEAAEIEAALEQLSAVRRALVTAREDASGNYQLIAYLECGEADLDLELLDQHLARWLPSYMLPGHTVVMERLPLLLNGKIDRSQLPEPSERSGSREFEAPATETERAVAALWCELLEIGRVGRRDDFFKLGGHSLLATRLVGRLNDNFGVRLPLATIFNQGRLAQLALSLDLLCVSAAITGEQAVPHTEVGEI